MQIVIPDRGRGRGGELRGRKIYSPSLDRFEYRPIGEANFSELSQWNAEAGPSVSEPVRETFPIAPQRVADQNEIDLVEAPIPIINLDEYEMVESEHETDATMWEDYFILLDSPDSTFPGFGTIISPIVMPNDDDDQIVQSEPVVSPVMPSFTYPSLQDSLFTALWREYDAIRREDTPWTDMEAPVIPAPAQWEPYCYMYGETGHNPRMCHFYRPYGNSATRYIIYDGTVRVQES
ncbi:hypothetical protein ISN45_Aa07g030940 [Arabidopsis thaliana x Arabidopsis arenosa]|uniref:Uncharacterized protein n=1 Tax=Arabidopsis thaliana x Arabidopsis arenosa TaxID=1240361 RepID=A0A8T1YBY4_9BRAS|nr:hypothetical protein ISN45_Aa07g030940 [Arabidopsis thaliana x Arabidopsis arenosa]